MPRAELKSAHGLRPATATLRKIDDEWAPTSGAVVACRGNVCGGGGGPAGGVGDHHGRREDTASQPDGSHGAADAGPGNYGVLQLSRHGRRESGQVDARIAEAGSELRALPFRRRCAYASDGWG